MVTTAVKNTAVDFPYAMPNVATAQKEKAAGQDFMKILANERQKAQKSEEMQNQSNTETKAEDVQETEHDVQDEYEKKDVEAVEEETTVEEKQDIKVEDSQETANAQTKEEPSQENMEAVEEALRRILEEMQAKLQMSEEEILGAAEDLGLSVVDLLNPENMASLVLTLEGQESPIHLVTDEMMYQNVQELTAFVEEQAAQLLEETNLSPEELEVLMEQLKQMEEDMAAESVTDEMLADTTDELLVSVKGEAGSVEGTQEVMTGVEQMQKHEGTSDEEGTTQDGETSFQNQQSNIVDYQAKADQTQTEQTTAADFMKEGSIDTEQLLRQLTDQVKIQHGEEITEMELQLHPASLGTIHVNLATKGGVVTAELTTQNEAVKNAIEAQVVQLKSNLEEQGVKVEAIEVSVASHELEKNLDQNNENRGEARDSERTESIRTVRRRSINLNDIEDTQGLEGEALAEDEATRLAVEMMTMHGNSMDLMA